MPHQKTRFSTWFARRPQNSAVAEASTGRQAIEAHAPHHVALVREHFVDRLDPADLATLTRLLARLDDPGTATP